MYDANDPAPTPDEVIALAKEYQPRFKALRKAHAHLEDQFDGLLGRRDELQEQVDELTRDHLLIGTMPLSGGRRWAFVPDAMTLAISPGIDAATELRLLAQVKPPPLVACDVCGAPVWSNASCGMHAGA